MEPRIQYARTADGVSIAFWAIGEGTPLIPMNTPPFSHIQLEWEWPVSRRAYEKLAQRRRFVRYDGRGSGLSDRDITDFSLDAHLLDLEAVVEKLEAERLSLLAYGDAGPVAIGYAARHPEKVAHLILWATYARGGFQEEPAVQALYGLLDRDWPLFTEALAHTVFSWSTAAHGSWWAQFLPLSTTPEVTKAVWKASFDFDVMDLLPRVKSRTLVLHPAQVRWATLDQARLLASRIPNARLVVLEGVSGVLLFEESGAVMRAIEEFLSEGEETRGAALAKEDVHTILFTDIESSTALTQRLGDAKAQELLRTHNTIVRDALKACSGSEIKHTGDGIMASFPSASRALECAIGIQRAVAAQVGEHPEMPLRVRIGLNAGEPVAEEQDLFGTAVQLARRVCDHAEPGQILVSDVVRQLAMGKGFLFSDHGDVGLRGFEDPVRLYEVRWRED
jgi:class 3 adenylate cyclase